MAMDTFNVGSFKNVLNMFHDIRISFGNEEVKLQSSTGMKMFIILTPACGSHLKLTWLTI